MEISSLDLAVPLQGARESPMRFVSLCRRASSPLVAGVGASRSVRGSKAIFDQSLLALHTDRPHVSRRVLYRTTFPIIRMESRVVVQPSARPPFGWLRR